MGQNFNNLAKLPDSRLVDFDTTMNAFGNPECFWYSQIRFFVYQILSAFPLDVNQSSNSKHAFLRISNDLVHCGLGPDMKRHFSPNFRFRKSRHALLPLFFLDLKDRIFDLANVMGSGGGVYDRNRTCVTGIKGCSIVAERILFDDVMLLVVASYLTS